jgi:hypothetical protein
MGIVLCANGYAAAQECQKLPPAVREYLVDHKAWSVLDIEHLRKDDQTLWRKYHPQKCPGMTAAKFDQTGRDFYALALMQRMPPGFIEKLVVLRKGDHRVEEWTISPASKTPILLVVWRVPPGVYLDEETGKKVRIPNDSIIYEEMEAGSLQYHYKAGKFLSLQASQ